MPYLLETPESWLRDKKRDLHVIEVDTRPCAEDPDEYEYVCPLTKGGLPEVLAEWLRAALPQTATGIIGASELSGWIEGGPISPFVDFDAEGLARYVAEWEGDGQRAAGSGFRRVTHDYRQWRAQLSACVVSRLPPEAPQNCWWWDTPIGLLWSPHRFMEEGDAYSSVSNYRDLWIQAQELYPELSGLSLDDVVIGRVHLDRKLAAWHCAVLLPIERSVDLMGIYVGEHDGYGALPGAPLTKRQQEIREWLGLGEESVTFFDDFAL